MQVKVDAPIPVKVSASQLEPGLVGILRPVILLPLGITDQLSPCELKVVIAHELCHWRRQDNLLAAIHMLVESLLWFFPLVWFIGKRLNAERERACDESVLAQGTDPHTYAEGILKVCRSYLQSPLSLVSGVSGADLTKRIEDIAENKSVLNLNAARKVMIGTTAAFALALPLAVGLVVSPVLQTQAKASQIASIQARNAGILPDAFAASVPENNKDLGRAIRKVTSPASNPPVIGKQSNHVIIARSPLVTATTAIVAKPDLMASNDPISARIPDLGVGDSPASNPNNQQLGPQQSAAGSMPNAQAATLLNVSGRNALDASQINIRSRFACRNLTTVTGVVISPHVIQMRSLVCGNPIGNRIASFGDDLREDPINRDGFRNVAAAHSADRSIVTMNVSPATPSDAEKMVVGKVVTISGDFSLIQTDSMNFLVADNAAYLHGDPFQK